jgi:hypothetical protein
MKIAEIVIAVESGQQRSPYDDARDALKSLLIQIQHASHGSPVLGGELYNPEGDRVGQYVVRFEA